MRHFGDVSLMKSVEKYENQDISAATSLVSSRELADIDPRRSAHKCAILSTARRDVGNDQGNRESHWRIRPVCRA